MKTVLFVCTGNTCRSSMAEAIFNDMLNKRKIEGIRGVSAGTAAFDGQVASANAISAMHSKGLDLKGHRAKRLSASLMEQADLILTMTQDHKRQALYMLPAAAGKVYTLMEFAGIQDPLCRDIKDPYGQSADHYKECAMEIEAAIEKALNRILEHGDGSLVPF